MVTDSFRDKQPQVFALAVVPEFGLGEGVKIGRRCWQRPLAQNTSGFRR